MALPEHGNLISGMGVDFRDLNNDGFPDIVSRRAGHGDLSRSTRTMARACSPRLPHKVAWPLSAIPCRVTARTSRISITMVGRTFSSAAATCSLPRWPRPSQIDQPNTVFRNVPSGKWAALTEEAGFNAQPPRRHRGAAYGDFNHDGKLDMVVTALSAPAEIWINDSPNHNHWLELALRGTKSNRDGIGARIRIDGRRANAVCL